MNRIVEPGNPLAELLRAPHAVSAAETASSSATHVSVQPVLLAGGADARPWPLSESSGRARVRQRAHDAHAADQAALLDATLARVERALRGDAALGTLNTPDTLDPRPAAPLIVCDAALQRHARAYAGERVQRARLVVEPCARRSAPALSVAALAARAARPARPAGQGDDPLLVALPADQPIADDVAFADALHAALRDALVHASRGAIVTLGVPPRRAATAYGYIRTGVALGTRGARAIARFVEKPDAELAERYVASGEYWWNSGIVVVRASVWLSAIALCRPLIAAACAQAFERATVDDDGAIHLARDAFAACPADSIDYAVMERLACDARLTGVAVPLIAGRASNAEHR